MIFKILMLLEFVPCSLDFFCMLPAPWLFLAAILLAPLNPFRGLNYAAMPQYLFAQFAPLTIFLYRSFLACPAPFLQSGGKCWHVPALSLSWSAGRTHCQGLATGADLAMVKTHTEQQWMRDYMSAIGRGCITAPNCESNSFQ